MQSFDDYVASLQRITPHVDPLTETPETTQIRRAAAEISQLPFIDRRSLSDWIAANPNDVPALGLTVGLPLEKLRNTLKYAFDTSGWVTLARRRSTELIDMLDDEFDLCTLVERQRNTTYTFGDVLVERAGGRQSASRAGRAGRRVEDEIEEVANNLGLKTRTRGRFVGRNGRTAPFDLGVFDGGRVAIAVAAKGFDSTGSKLTDSVREVEEMADVRLPNQFIMVVIDGIGWRSRQSDLRRIYELRSSDLINGMYTLNSIETFRNDLETASRLRGLLPPTA